MAKKVSVVLSHWYHLVEGLQHSPQQFYGSLEEAINRRQIPGVILSRVDYLEGGAFSAKREYVRAQRKELVFDVCAAPFGNGFFVSWWLGESRSSWGSLIALGLVALILILFVFLIDKLGFFPGVLTAGIVSSLLLVLLGVLVREGSIPLELSLSELPLFGAIYARFFEPVTYYKIDTTLMFQESVHVAVLEVVDQATQAKGLRALSESERKPVLHQLFKK